MITNETRAKLLGWERGEWDEVLGQTWLCPCHNQSRTLPSFDTDANAVAELRAFVRARGKMRTFVDALAMVLHDEWRSEDRDHRAGFTGTRFDLLDATPQQQCAAFDIVFKDELEKL